MIKTIVISIILSGMTYAQSITNKSNGEVLNFEISGNSMAITHIGSDGYQSPVNTLEIGADGEQEIYSSNDVYRYESIAYLREDNKYGNHPGSARPIGKLYSYSSLGVLNVCDAALTAIDDASVYNTSGVKGIGLALGAIIAMPICMVAAVPGTAILATVGAGESVGHGAKYFFDTEAIALRKLNRVLKGKDVRANNRVFTKLLNDLSKI